MRPSTKERIEKAIEELGYTPNRAARQLKTGHAPIIGLIVPWLLLPGVLVIVVVLAFNFMGDGVRDAADPYAR